MSYLDRTALVDAGPALEAAGLVHRVRQPVRAGPHPTVVMLHGLGGDESAMWPLSPVVPRDWLVAAPRGPLDLPVGGHAWRDVPPGTWAGPESFEPAVAALVRFVDALPGLYGADSGQIHLMGFSQGAALAFAAAMTHPRRYRAIASIVGFVPTADALRPAAFSRLPVFMAVGKRDPLVPGSVSQASAELLRSAEAALVCREYDVGHKMHAAGLRDLREWYVRLDTTRTTGPLDPLWFTASPGVE